MPTRSWASALVAAVALAAAAAAVADGIAVRASPAGPGRTRLELSQPRAATLVVTRDEVVPANARPAGVSMVAAVGDAVAIVVDRYPSRLNLGAGACGAGEERFLRVLRLAPKPARETWRVKLASCWQNVEPKDDGVHWDSASGELRVDWLAGPKDQSPETGRWHVGDDGAVQALGG